MPYSREERCKAYRARPPLTLARIHMDEIDFRRAYENLRVLIDHIGEPDEQISKTHIRNAMLTIAAMLDSLNRRITEMQNAEDDE